MNATTITTGKVRFSFANLFTPVKPLSGEGEPKYSLTILVDKSDKATIAAINAAIEAAKEEGKSKKWSGKIPSKLALPLHDGDVDSEYEAYEGKYYLNCKNSRAPKVVDRNKQEIFDSEEVYSGCYGRVNITFYPFSVPGNNGIAVSLGPVQKLADGQRLGGNGVSVDEAFDDLDDDVEI